MQLSKTEIRKQLTVRPGILAACALALGLLFVGSSVASSQAPTSSIYLFADDISDSTDATAALEAQGSTGDVGDSGHGNNADGVDSSNPGQAGPGSDSSCTGGGTCIDDEVQP